MMFLVLLLLSILSCYWFISIYFDCGDFSIYPGRVPFIGHLHKFKSWTTVGLWEMVEEAGGTCLKIGGAVLFYFGFLPVYLITEPDDYFRILNVEYHKPRFLRLFSKVILGNGLLFGAVPVWKGRRKMFNPTFNQLVLDNFVYDFNYHSSKLIEDFESMVGKGYFDHTNFIEKKSMRTICDTREKREDISKMPKSKVKDNTFKPYIEKLLEEENKSLDLQDIKDEVNVMIVSGFETSTSLLVFILTLVGAHPNVQDNILKEIKEVFGDLDRDVTKEDLSKLQYIEAVIKETSRYWPVVPFIGRALTEDLELSHGVLKKGYICIILLHAIMRHPVWGPDADEFIPERWLDPMRLPKNAYVAFSYGKRNCIGKNFTIMSMKVTLVHIFRRFKLHSDASNVKKKSEPVLKLIAGHYISIVHRN